MSYNYTGFVSALANLVGTTTTQPNFVIELPNAIDYAEQRLFRDLDLVFAQVLDTSQVCTPNYRYIGVPGGFVSVDGVNIITPAGVQPNNGKRNQLVKVNRDLIDILYPDGSIVGVPTYFVYFTQGFGPNAGLIILGPWPDQGYVAEIAGTAREQPLSASNPNTFLATNLPDLMLIAAMIHMQAYKNNWSSIGNDPAASATYETQYQKLLVGADAEEMRKRYTGTTVLPPRGADKQPTSPDAKP